MSWQKATGMLVVLIVTGSWGAVGLAQPESPWSGVTVDQETGMERSVAPDGGASAVELDAPPSAQAGSVVFVDRDHRAAVSRQVEIAGSGDVGVASWWLNNERVARYDFPAGRVWEHDGQPYGLTHSLAVDADASVVVGAVQGPTPAQGVPLVAGARLVGWPGGEGPEPALEREQYMCAGGGCPVVSSVSDAGLLAVASPGRVVLYGPGEALAPLWTGDYAVSQGFTPLRLQGVDISADGSTIAVTTYERVFVFRVPFPVPVADMPNNSQTVAQVSGDGTFVAMGGFQSTARLFELGAPDVYVQKWAHNVGDPWVTAVDVADDGTVVAGTFNYNGGNSGKAVALDADTGTPLWECLCYGDYVDDVAVTPDGSRAAAVTWGTFGGTAGDALTVFDVDTGSVLHRVSGAQEPGSLHSVAISDDGTQVIAGGKAVHARMFGNGGQVYGIEIP